MKFKSIRINTKKKKKLNKISNIHKQLFSSKKQQQKKTYKQIYKIDKQIC